MILFKLIRFIFRYLKLNLLNLLKFFIVDTVHSSRVKVKLLKIFFIKNIGENVDILTGVRWFLGKNIYIEDNVFINKDVYFDDKAPIKIGSGTWIGHYVKFITATHDIKNMEELAKPIEVGKYCWIGANVTILPGVKIGDFCVIGANSVVTKDVNDKSVVVGNPAKKIKDRELELPYKVAGGKYINEF
ncbi:Acyl-[acyl-carrier-protein]--UDP-N-acetylglucosamine O-acyltransferase [Geobacillus stearothermophilus]|uniref:Acyl-[acyl-carrier-protein]--UDP-N-acetylglucosamine O-acyltransferase n=1 Tax=Geobacillus stearothermophilus TaxID=1422 RepID=A0A150MPI7_GEOSE|nr:DapH/DapD/GlmU-related protein [Geobacillus stearothermophilus]KYD26378.1 Acyl-[acyl-carrier-protein]--UDP-N-acetylglucosamine O-acyltransferase [Geobacillus stearothermophilus]